MPFSFPPSIRSSKTNQQLFVFIKPQTPFFSQPAPIHLFRQPWSNVFIIIFAFATQMGCCSFLPHLWWAPPPTCARVLTEIGCRQHIQAHINKEHSYPMNHSHPCVMTVQQKHARTHSKVTLTAILSDLQNMSDWKWKKQRLQLELDSLISKTPWMAQKQVVRRHTWDDASIVWYRWWTLFSYVNF